MQRVCDICNRESDNYDIVDSYNLDFGTGIAEIIKVKAYCPGVGYKQKIVPKNCKYKLEHLIMEGNCEKRKKKKMRVL